MNVMVAVAFGGAAISIAGTTKYAVEVVRGHTKPKLSSWAAWTTANGVLAIVALLNGNPPAAAFDAVATLTNGSVLVLGVAKLKKRRGRKRPRGKLSRRDRARLRPMRKLSRTERARLQRIPTQRRSSERSFDANDGACLIVSGLCLGAIFVYPHATYLDAMLAMSANVMATWPTIVHAWQHPEEETPSLFVANSIAYGLGLLGVVVESGFSLGNMAGPLVSTCTNVALVCIALSRGVVVAKRQARQQPSKSKPSDLLAKE